MKRNQKLNSEQISALNVFVRDGSHSGREVRRAQAVLLVDQEVNPAAIIAVTGYQRRQIFELRRKYVAHGIGALQDNHKGKPKELLTKAQRAEIVETVRTKKPCQLDLYYRKYDYWTTGVLAEYITRTYDIAYKSKTSHYVLFREAKFSYHKPGRVSERRNDEEVKQWRIEAKKRIEKAWRDPNVVILTEDEMHLSTQTTVQKIWLPKGEYPKIEVARRRESRSIYGFLNVKTGDEHAFKTKWQNMYITADILPKVRQMYPDKKILLIWDQAGWHRGQEAQRAIKADGNIETIYFPTAAPDENPQEHVWKSGRTQVSHNAFIQDIDVTTDSFVDYLNTKKFLYSLVGLSAGS